MEDVDKMYKEYAALGGNGSIKGIVEEMRQIPRTKKE
jgi:hypothetical protein